MTCARRGDLSDRMTSPRAHARTCDSLCATTCLLVLIPLTSNSYSTILLNAAMLNALEVVHGSQLNFEFQPCQPCSQPLFLL